MMVRTIFKESPAWSNSCDRPSGGQATCCLRTNFRELKGMLIDNVYVLSTILVTLGLVRLALSKSAFSTLVGVSLGSLLSFCVFENFLNFLPVVCFLLKDYVNYSFLFFKTMYLDLKNFFSSDSGQAGKEVVLEMKGKEKETILPEKSFNPVAVSLNLVVEKKKGKTK